MGKHDKKDEHITVFTWQPMPDEFYKARISTLEKENARLREELTEKGRSIGVYEAAIDHLLKGKIKMLEAAIVKGALREVLA